MSRKHCGRRAITPLPPRGLRPRLTADQVCKLGVAHSLALKEIAEGNATEATLWEWVGGTLTWSRVAELLQAGAPEMRDQLDLAAQLVERYGRTGRVVFTGPEYQRAKDGVGVMDQLAEMVDLPTAAAAADWSEQRISQLQAGTARPERQTA
jgi:hypothetical protein